jgi:hypothetical protein
MDSTLTHPILDAWVAYSFPDGWKQGRQLGDAEVDRLKDAIFEGKVSIFGEVGTRTLVAKGRARYLVDVVETCVVCSERVDIEDASFDQPVHHWCRSQQW